MKSLITISLALFLMSCAHLPDRRNETPKGYDGVVQVDQMNKNTGSLCFEGFTRVIGIHSKCQSLGYEKVKLGVTRYACTDKDSEISKDKYLSHEFFVLAVNPHTGKLYSPPGRDVLPICADPSGMLVTSDRD